MLGTILERIAAHLPERRIIIDGKLYLRRFYLWGRMPDNLADRWNCGVRPKERLWFLPTTYLHCFHAPDADRDCHNHPWPARGRILVGGYLEERWTKHPELDGAYKFFVCRNPGDRQKLDPDTFHRVSQLFAPKVWTLFWIGPYQQDWGYWDAAHHRFEPHRERHADPNNGKTKQ